MDKLIWLLFWVNMLFQASTWIFAPFFPSIAEDERGVSSLLIGIAMSMNALSFVMASFIFGHIMKKIGRRCAMYSGIIITALTMIGFGSIIWIHDSTTFISVALILRFIGGIGQASIAVSSYAMAAVRYKDCLQQKVGLLEAGNGAGFFVGPILGGVIYQFTHFWVPFFLCAVLLIVLLVILKEHLDEGLDSVPLPGEGDIKIGYRYLMKHRRIFFASIAQFFTLYVLTFGQPIFGPRLEKDYGFSMALIGLCFAIPTIAYALTGPLLLEKFTKKFEYRATMMIGFLILVVGGVLIGPSKVLHFPSKSSPMMLIGLAILGVGVASTIIPVIPEMLQVVDQDERAHDKVSAIFSVFGGFGQIVSPPVAGLLNDTVGFNYSLDICAVTILLFLIIYFAFWDGYGAFRESFKNTFSPPNIKETELKNFQSVSRDSTLTP